MSSSPRVLFVSKPMSPPFRDGSKCLVRDLCTHLPEIEAHLMSTPRGAAELQGRATLHSVYRDPGTFAPGLAQNLQAFAWLSLSPRMDLWHSIFAPNPKSSMALGALARLRRARTCQTIASPPRSFERPDQLLFGDVIVAQSDWTRKQFVEAYKREGKPAPAIFEIPPPCPRFELPGRERQSQARRHLGLSENESIFLYPGDLEVSSAGTRLCQWSREMGETTPGAKLVMAYRNKTPRSSAIASDLAAGCDPNVVLFSENVPDILALVATSRALVFPVDDLFGKVDLPIVLLEALRLGTPVVALAQGPLLSLRGAELLDSEPKSWMSFLRALDQDETVRLRLIESGRQAVREYYEPDLIAAKYFEIYEGLMRDKARSQIPLVMQ